MFQGRHLKSYKVVKSEHDQSVPEPNEKTFSACDGNLMLHLHLSQGVHPLASLHDLWSLPSKSPSTMQSFQSFKNNAKLFSLQHIASHHANSTKFRWRRVTKGPSHAGTADSLHLLSFANGRKCPGPHVIQSSKSPDMLNNARLVEDLQTVQCSEFQRGPSPESSHTGSNVNTTPWQMSSG